MVCVLAEMFGNVGVCHVPGDSQNVLFMLL